MPRLRLVYAAVWAPTPARPGSTVVVEAISARPLLLRLLGLDDVGPQDLHEDEGNQEDEHEGDGRQRRRAVEPLPDLVDDQDRQRGGAVGPAGQDVRQA